MKAVASLLGLVLVLAIVMLVARHQLQAIKAPAAASAAGYGASAPFGGTSSPSVQQFQQELDRTMAGAASRAASAGGDE